MNRALSSSSVVEMARFAIYKMTSILLASFSGLAGKEIPLVHNRASRGTVWILIDRLGSKDILYGTASTMPPTSKDIVLQYRI
jgi:nicotinamide mononucleotide (NMN) deamidase PncC